jgi:hypothetical protein
MSDHVSIGSNLDELREDLGGGTFNGGTITDPLTITPDGGGFTDSLRVDAPTSNSWVRVGDGEGAALAVNGADQESLSVLSEYVADDYAQMMDVSGADGTVLSARTDGQVDVTLYQPDTNGFRVVDNATSRALLRCAIVGFVFHLTAAPSDGELGSGDCALWFDQTNGAAKLMIKGKSANGTVVTGSVPLT